MARPLKEGLEYFSHDIDASNDDKIEALESIYGNDGYAFYFKLLERIYRTPHGELDISDAETVKVLAKSLHMGIKRFEKILETALKRGCFSAEIYKEKKVLSSNGIKKRLEVVSTSREKMRQRYTEKKLEQGVSRVGNMEETGSETPPSKYKDKDKLKEKEKEIKSSEEPVVLLEKTKDAEELWGKILGGLKERVNKSNFETWLAQTKGLQFADGVLLVAVPTIFARQYIETNQISLIENVATTVCGGEVRVRFREDIAVTGVQR
jgi:hypothetical protein